MTFDSPTLTAILVAGLAFTTYGAVVTAYCKRINNRTKASLQECVNTLLATESLWHKIQKAINAPNPEVETLRAALNECASPIYYAVDEHPHVYLQELQRRQSVAAVALGVPLPRHIPSNPSVTKPALVT